MEIFDDHIQINHYDAEGLRSGIEEDGRLVQFIFRSQEVVTQLEEEKGMTRYIRGYDLIASDADSARTYYHYASDELGNITHVVGGDTSRVFANGEIRQACSHYACGNPNPITGYGCAQKINRHNVNNITGFAIDQEKVQIGRDYVSDLWNLSEER